MYYLRKEIHMKRNFKINWGIPIFVSGYVKCKYWGRVKHYVVQVLHKVLIKILEGHLFNDYLDFITDCKFFNLYRFKGEVLIQKYFNDLLYRIRV